VDTDVLLYSEEELESGQRSPTRKRRTERERPQTASKRTKHDHSTNSLDKRIKKSEDSIQKLKAHAERKTCPKSLRCNVRASIAPDDEFKEDINCIRKDAEEKKLKKIIMSKRHLIEEQPRLRENFKEPPIISYKRGKSLKDIPVRAKLYRSTDI